MSQAPGRRRPRRRALICDFNGVIADDETPHFLAFQQALREEGIELSQEEYYGRFLGMDERNCLSVLLTGAGAPDAARRDRIAARKAALFEDWARTRKPRLFPGVVPFIKEAARRWTLAIASGGRREQIRYALEGTPIEHDFAVVVAAEDTRRGKPDPEVYELALSRLNAQRREPLGPQDCLVLEDSRAGIQSARRAGMRVAAVASTYPAEQLRDADLVVPGLDARTADALAALFD